MLGRDWFNSTSQFFRIGPGAYPHQLISSPLTTIVRVLYTLLNYLVWILASVRHQRRPRIRVVCVSDTHSQRCNIPYGDLLIHAGDLTLHGSAAEIQDAIDWLKSLPHPHKVVICGNSDRFFDVSSRLADDAVTTSSVDSRPRERDCPPRRSGPAFDWGDIHYLQQTSACLSFPCASSGVQRQINIYGAPNVPLCGGPENAFQYPIDHNPWAGNIPASTDILVTHTPPKYHLDWYHDSPEGCPFLLQELWKIRPLLHVFGHVHTSYGLERVHWDSPQRWWEKYCLGFSKLSSAGLGLFGSGDFLQLRLWRDAAMVLLSAMSTIVREMVGLRHSERSPTLMVNAACMSGDNLTLSKEPIVVYI
jgi:hypothetical protein